MKRYMLDTSIVSHIIKGDIPVIRERLVTIPMQSVVLSSITLAELRYGLAKRSYPTGLTIRVHEFLIRVTVLAWNKDVADVYANLRVACEADGITLAPLDLMIAAHARALDAVLVTRDKSFSRVLNGLVVDNWE